MSGTLSGPVELQFSWDKTVQTSAGTHPGELTIISTTSDEVIATVILTMAAKPEIEISTQKLTLSTDEHTKSFTLKISEQESRTCSRRLWDYVRF